DPQLSALSRTHSPQRPSRDLSPQGTHKALAYTILSRLSSTSDSRAAPRCTWLQAERPVACGAPRNSPGGGGLGTLGRARPAGRGGAKRDRNVLSAPPWEKVQERDRY